MILFSRSVCGFCSAFSGEASRIPPPKAIVLDAEAAEPACAAEKPSVSSEISGPLSLAADEDPAGGKLFDRGRDRDPAHPEHPDKLRFRWDPVTCLQTAIPDLAYNMIFDLYIFRGVEFLVI